MNAKKLLPLFLILLSLNAVSGTPQTEITLEKTEPIQPSPGDTVKMFVVVANDGSSDATYSPLEIETTGDIRYTGTTSNFQDSFKLCGGCQTTGTLYFKVSAEAETGTHPIDVKASTGDVGKVGKYELEVKGEPDILLDSSNIQAVPGEESSFNLTVENVGTGKASQLVLKQNTDSFSFEPSKLSLGTLEAGEKLERQLSIRPDRDLEAGIRQLEFDLSYIEGGNKTETAERITAEVVEKAEMAVSDFEVSEKEIGKTTDLTVEIENLGPGEAEKITSELECEGASVESGRDFVGRIGDDESIPVSFRITPGQEEANCEVEVKYSDSSPKSLSEEISFNASKKSSPVIPLVAGLIVLAAVVFLWRKRRKDELEEI